MKTRNDNIINKKALWLTVVLHVMFLLGLFFLDTDMEWLNNLMELFPGSEETVDLKA